MSKEKQPIMGASPGPIQEECEPYGSAWELVRACEDDKENWLQRYSDVKATIQVNFTEHATGKYKNIIKSENNLLKMVMNVFEYFDKSKTNLDTCLDEIARLATKNGAITIKEIRDICTPVLNPNETQKGN